MRSSVSVCERENDGVDHKASFTHSRGLRAVFCSRFPFALDMPARSLSVVMAEVHRSLHGKERVLHDNKHPVLTST